MHVAHRLGTARFVNQCLNEQEIYLPLAWRQTEMKAELSRRCVVAIAIFSLFLLIVDCGDAASPTQARIIDRNGIHIPSIFHGISPNPRFAVEYQRTLKGKGRNPGSCFVLQASYHYNRGTGQLLNVQGTGCGAHYQVSELRNCGSQCGGGQEDWTYSDSLLASYCDGYAVDYLACNTGNCREDSWCWEENICQ